MGASVVRLVGVVLLSAVMVGCGAGATNDRKGPTAEDVAALEAGPARQGGRSKMPRWSTRRR